jgi:HEAT repeat protein
MDDTTKKLLRLLQVDRPPELRCAAAAVLGEVGGRDTEVGKALHAHVDDPEPAVRLSVITALGQLKFEPALPTLLARIQGGAGESDLAARAAARLGPRATRTLQELMPQVAPGVRRRIAAALAAAGTTSAETAAVDALLDVDPGVVEATTRSLIAGIPLLPEGHRAELIDHLLELLANKKRKLGPASEMAVVRLLAVLGDPRAVPPLWERTLPSCPVEVRAAALQALGKWAGKPTKEQQRRLFTCAADPDFRVAAPALLLLQALPPTDRSVPDWLPLLEAPDVAVRRVALDKVGARNTAAVAAALLRQLDHPDQALREDALARLTNLSHGRAVLTQALVEAETADRAWMLARAQAPFAAGYPPAWREELFAQASAALEAGDRRADALLFLLREAGAADARDRLARRALALRQKKNYTAALPYLRYLARDPACGLDIRLELAAIGLKAARHDLAAEARAGDPVLEQFARLLQTQPLEVCQYLEKAKWLTAEDLLYLGFHFAEKDGPEKKVGGRLLNLVVKRSPRTKLAQNAKSKLRSTGL